MQNISSPKIKRCALCVLCINSESLMLYDKTLPCRDDRLMQPPDETSEFHPFCFATFYFLKMYHQGSMANGLSYYCCRWDFSSMRLIG